MPTHMNAMSNKPRNEAKSWRESNAMRIALVCLGWLLIIAALAIGPLPGPGALILAPIGMALVLKNSLWAKKRYSRFVRTHPEYGRWLNWMMGRSKGKGRPPVPDFKRDLMFILRRDDDDHEMP
jgi:hypothetical protein